MLFRLYDIVHQNSLSRPGLVGALQGAPYLFATKDVHEEVLHGEHLQLLFVVEAFVLHKQKVVHLKLAEQTVLMHDIVEAKQHGSFC